MKNFRPYLLSLVLILIGLLFSNVYVNKIDFFIRDSLQNFNSTLNSKISKDIVIIDIDANSPEFSNPVSSVEIEALVSKLQHEGPKAILVNLSPLDFIKSPKELESLKSVFTNYKIYLTAETNKNDKSSFSTEPVFSNYPYKYDSSLCTDNDGSKFSPRRMFLEYYGESETETFWNLMNKVGIQTYRPEQFEHSFDRMNTRQLFNKFHSPNKFINLNASEIILNKVPSLNLKNKIIVIGRIDEYSFMYAEGLGNIFGKPLAGSTMANSFIPTHHVIANHINTLVEKDYVKLFKNDLILYLTLCLLITLVFLKIDSKIKLYIFLLIIPLITTLQILIYSLTSFYVDFVSVYIMLFFLQYLGVPILAFAILKEQKFKQLDEINNARIDSLISLSEKLAHDIRSPLSAINLLTKKANFQTEEQKSIFQQSVKRIELITENLITKYRPESQNANRTNFDSFTFNELIEPIVSEKKVIFPNIEYTIGESKNVKISADKLELARLLSNLLDNSIHAVATKSSPQIKVSAKETAKDLEIKIEDNGIGISSNIIKVIGNERISTKSEHKSSGIGLLYSKRALEKMGGSFNIQSKEGQYTIITVTIPRNVQ